MGLLKLIGFVAIWKKIGTGGKWKLPEITFTIPERKKYVSIEYGLSQWIGRWEQIVKWYKLLRLSHQVFCLQTCITLPIGFLISSWSFGIFGIFLFLTYAVYYKYWICSKKLLIYKPKGRESLYLQECKAVVKTSLFFNFFPFIFLLGYKPSFDDLNHSLSCVIDSDVLYRMNPSLFSEKLMKLNKKPEELSGYQVNLEEFQETKNLF